MAINDRAHLPKIRERLPQARSFKKEFVDEGIMVQEKNLILGPLGSNPRAVHPTGKVKPAGGPPREMHDQETREMSNLGAR